MTDAPPDATETIERATVEIVMIEDDDGHARLIEKNIRRAGIANPIRRFADGTAALGFLGGNPGGRALVLLDLNLPDMNGTEVLARIKADPRLRPTPVVVLTTTDDRQEIDRCLELGADACITKPVDHAQFAAAIGPLARLLAVMQRAAAGR